VKVSIPQGKGWKETCAIRFCSAEKPDRMRGPDVGRMWYDELGTFPLQRAADNVWAQRAFVLRSPVAGGPKGIVSMTPKPTPDVIALEDDAYSPACPAIRGGLPCNTRVPELREFAERTCPKCGHKFWPEFRIVTGSSHANRANLAPEMLRN